MADDRVTIYGPTDLDDRAPTLAFNVDGHTAGRRTALAARQIAVWDGNYYAVEAMASFGVDAAVRAGIAPTSTTPTSTASSTPSTASDVRL